MTRIGNFIRILIFCLLFNLSFAQQSEIDSLKNLLSRQDSTEKIKTYYALGLIYEQSLPDTALAFYQAGLKLSEETHSETLIAKGYNGIGNINFISGRYAMALDYFFKALKIFESKHLDNSTIYCLQYIGNAGAGNCSIHW